jgi:hypothetical protein
MEPVPPLAVFVVLMCWTVAVGEADVVFLAALARVLLARQLARVRR